MQEEKGGPTCQGFLSLCKLYAPIATVTVKSDPLGQKLFKLTDKKTKMEYQKAKNIKPRKGLGI